MNRNPDRMPLHQRFGAHLNTVNTHRFRVMKHCFSCGLYGQGLTHDLSKYEPSEFLVSVHYFQGTRSPYMKEKEEKGYSLGWLHHKGRNRHHWEYWYDMLDGKWVPLEMPFRYVVEMVCDRIAACETYEKENYTKQSALNYFLSRPDRQFMHPETAKLLESILRDIAERGEDAVFKDLREQLRRQR
ncbi:MAG: catalase [Solobacterium sp.]|nr:catalase [Solobacterium sp.]